MEKKIEGFFICRNRILNEKISIHAKMVYIVLRRFAGNKNECFPSISVIAIHSSIRSAATVHKALRELTTLGYIIKTQQERPNGGWRSNKYFLLK